MWVLLIQNHAAGSDSGLERSLENEGFVVESANSLLRALTLSSSNPYDVAVLICPEGNPQVRDQILAFRNLVQQTPLLIIAGASSASYRATWLDAGANDVLTSPFELIELSARLRVLGRNQGSICQRNFNAVLGDLELDIDRHLIRSDLGDESDLRVKEFRLLELFVQRPNKLITRSVIAEQVWGMLEDVSDDVINMTVSSLRRKIKDVTSNGDKPSIQITTVRGYGYLLRTPSGFIN
jgi:DNA-binding response OmpR family regulator